MITEKELKELWRKEDYRIQVEDLGYETCMLGWIFNLLQETIEADRKTFVSQELAELREWYPDALFKAEDLSRQVELLLPQIKRLSDENGFDAARERPTFDELERELNERWDEDGDCSKQAQYVISLFETK